MSNEGRKGGRAVGRYGTQAGVLAVVFLAALPPYRLTAQVGHEPAESPFRDIVSHQHVYFQVGEFFGNRAKPGVGAQGGPTFGVRFRNRLSGPLDLMVGATLIKSKRLVIDPTKPDSIRRVGTIDDNLLSTELQLALTLTGAKTWHGLAPWIGFGFGIVTPTKQR